jgi:hypothetical protein
LALEPPCLQEDSKVAAEESVNRPRLHESFEQDEIQVVMMLVNMVVKAVLVNIAFPLLP